MQTYASKHSNIAYKLARIFYILRVGLQSSIIASHKIPNKWMQKYRQMLIIR